MVDARTILLFVITILTGVFVWSRRTYVYWQRRRIKFVQPTHLLGNLKEVLRQQRSFGLLLRDFYFDERFAEEPLIGIYLFHQPALLLRDLELVRMVLVEDFVSFSNRFARCDAHLDKMGSLNLFFVKNPEWREIRTKMSPAFTGARIKQMFSLMEEIGCDLESYLNKLTDRMEQRSAILQVKEVCELYTTDLIASIAFGFRSYSLRNTQTEVGWHSRRMFTATLWRAIDFCAIFFLPKLVPLLGSKLFTDEHSQFLRRTIVKVIEEREQSGTMRNDLIEMLLTLKKEAALNQDKSHFTHQREYLAAQAAAFEVAGIETCAAALTFALYELAMQPLVQARLRAEIRTAFRLRPVPEEGLSYERVTAMQYLAMIVDETLRKYPIVPFIERECTPINKKRFYSFRPHVECFARRGMPIFISNYAIHHDPKHWPNPENFDPERFAPDRRSTIPPMAYLPFGAGPHNCIGMSIAQLLIKLGLIHFLRCHRVEICDQTVDSIRIDPKLALLNHEGGVYLQVVRCL